MPPFYDQLYVLNLERRPERLAATSRELARVGWDFTRWPAVDGLTLDPQLRTLDHNQYGDRFVYAVSLSLSQLLTAACEAGHQRVLVVEDDLVLADDLSPLSAALSDLPADFDLLYLGAHHQAASVPVTPNLARLRESYLCHGILFNRPAMELLGAALPGYSNETLYAELQARRGRCYGVTPNVAFQRAGELSDISGLVADYRGLLGGG